MADEVKVKGATAGVGSPEFVAYLLMCCIGRQTASTMFGDYSLPVVGGKDKDWVLDTYVDCLHVVNNGWRQDKA